MKQFLEGIALQLHMLIFLWKTDLNAITFEVYFDLICARMCFQYKSHTAWYTMQFSHPAVLVSFSSFVR